ncbi:hypothetical protein C0585_01945 [Candidatus Woesearchaeota archaeon]|nr:MAG: hypothetical protein C0585_01945 [Candidatus Woesearchaeota archaeon]
MTLQLLKYKEKLEQELENFFKRKKELSITLEEKEIITIIEDYTLRGGKRLRAYLQHLITTGLGGEDDLRAGMAMELLQSFFLIHDDIIDKDDYRRGGETPHFTYRKNYKQLIPANDNEHISNSLAILAGDLAFSYSNELMSKVSAKANIVMNKVSQTVIIGQKRDTLSAYKEYDEKEILENYRLKTASYTFLAPMRIGSIIAGQDIDFSKISENLGIAFQIQDDLLDYYGSEELGKPNFSDLKEGKKTIILARAKDIEYIQESIGKDDVDKEKIKELLLPIKEDLEKDVENRYEKAMGDINNLNITTKEEIIGLIKNLQGRKK